MRELTDQFVAALHRLHAEEQVDALAELFAEDATLSKLGNRHESSGREGARKFWLDYRAVFDDIEATFTHRVIDDQNAALEWTSEGTLHGGKSFAYTGVSVLEGTGGQISGFRTYYDTAAFLNEKIA